MSGTGVTLDQVRFAYAATPFRFDLRFPAGKISAVMGPSGSGKSTLLHLVAGFEAPEAGRVLIGGEDVTPLPPERRPVTVVFQENNLFAHLSVEKNVALGVKTNLRLSPAERARVGEALARVGLGGKETRLPRELSGGERGRAALARALLRDRPVLLLDEPFAALGPALRLEMLDLVGELQRERSLTVLLVTHQPEEARRLASHLVFLEDGAVSAAGPVKAFFTELGPESFRRYIGWKPGDPRKDGAA